MKRLSGTLLVVLAALLPTASCGTLLFPERKFEEHQERMDPNILILDGASCVFFVIPGLVAFLVDFHTGAIYLPEDVERGEGPFFHDVEE